MSADILKDFLSTASFERKVELQRLMITRERAFKSNGLAMYRPHRKQDKFHRAAWAKYRYLRTGNRFGKSDCGCAEDVAFAIGERPWYGENDPARYIGIPKMPTKGLIICTDWQKAEAVFTREIKGVRAGKLWKFIPEANYVRRDTDHGGNINRFTIKSKWGGESIISIEVVAAFKQNSQRGESEDYDWIHIDEPIPKDMYEAYGRGLMDRDGSAWFTCTPLREPWINEFFTISPRTILDPDEINIRDQDSVVIIGRSDDNPHVSQTGINKYASKLSDRDKAARLFGVPPELSDLVHPWFNDDHVYGIDGDCPRGWADMVTPPKDYTIRYHIDYHPVTPIAVLFAATAPDGTVWFFDEIFEQGSPDTIAEMILAKTKNYFVGAAWMDPSGFVENKVYKTVFADDLAEYGIITEKASKDLNRGIIMTNMYLRQRGKLNFGNHLKQAQYEFVNYMFQPPNKKPDKPVDKNDHMMEGLHRLIIGGLDYIPADEIYAEDSPVRESANYLLRL